jgi:hypothetical protein
MVDSQEVHKNLSIARSKGFNRQGWVVAEETARADQNSSLLLTNVTLPCSMKKCICPSSLLCLI